MGQHIELTATDGHKLDAYQAGPQGAERGLVVVQEIFGVNHHMRQVCDHFAELGFAVISPALFDRAERGVELGYGQDDIQRGIALRAAVPEAGTLADLQAAAQALGTRKTGIIGYCWGGTLAWAGATRLTCFQAAVGWYGGGIAKAKEAQPHCPVQLHFGETDHSIPLSDIEAIRAAHPEMDVFVYEGAGHGFGCDERPSYDKAATELAERRSQAFFMQHLA